MQKSADNKQNTVLWWVGWITLTIVSFFASCYFWTGFISAHVGTMDQKGVPIIWVTAVFGSWMVLLVPLIVVMYNKVDRAYEDTRLSREKAELEKAQKNSPVRSILVPEPDREIPKNLADKLKKIPRAIKRGHLVTAVLKNGSKVDNVFVLDGREILGIYNATEMTFKASDISDLVPADLDKIPAFEAKKWLRLDGAGAPLNP